MIKAQPSTPRSSSVSTPFKGEMTRPKQMTLVAGNLFQKVFGSIVVLPKSNAVALRLVDGSYGQVPMGRSSIGAWPSKVYFSKPEIGEGGTTVNVRIMYTDGQFAQQTLFVTRPTPTQADLFVRG